MGYRAVGFVAVAALVAGPVLAEKAFIPAADAVGANGVKYRTEISLANAKGARAAAVLARIGYEAGGASAAQKLTLAGGQSLRLSGLAGNGLVELDLAKSVDVTATLVVERAGGKTFRDSLPVLETGDYMPAGTAASLRIVSLPEDYRKVSVGAVNLSSRAMRCEARFEANDGRQLGAPIAFTVAPYAERRAGSFAGGKGRSDVASLNTVQCDQPFWTYAVAEQPSSGDVKVVYPMKDVTVPKTSSATTEATGSLVYEIPGQFFVASSKKWSYRFNMYFGSTRTFRQAITNFDVYHGGWDPKKTSGVHLVEWMQFDGWGTCLKYLNATTKMTKYRWLYKPKASIGGTTPILKPGNTYHITTAWDGVLRKNTYTATKGGIFYDTDFALLGTSSFTYSKLFVVFGHGSNGPHGPEARSPNWRWSNLKVELNP
jgi:hypothetical protein